MSHLYTYLLGTMTHSNMFLLFHSVILCNCIYGGFSPVSRGLTITAISTKYTYANNDIGTEKIVCRWYETLWNRTLKSFIQLIISLYLLSIKNKCSASLFAIPATKIGHCIGKVYYGFTCRMVYIPWHQMQSYSFHCITIYEITCFLLMFYPKCYNKCIQPCEYNQKVEIIMQGH